VPFCPECDRFYNPNTLTETGDCPDGHHVADPSDPAQAESPAPVPWHFKVMLTLLVLYLTWRFIQLGQALI
jgi:hypothetical protein